MLKLIQSTTAVGLVLSLSVPAPLFAQSGNGAVCAQQRADREFPCQLRNGQVMQSELDVLNARLARQQEELDTALNVQSIAAGDQVQDDADVQAAARVAEAESAIAQTEDLIAQERSRAAEAPAADPAPRQQAQPETTAQGGQAGQNQAGQNQGQNQAGQNQGQNQAGQNQGQNQAGQNQQEAPAQGAAANNGQSAQNGEPELTEAQQQRREERRAERRAARQAAAAAAATEQGANAEVQSETLSEQDVRRSDEEFDTAVTGDANQNDDDSGMSNLEKALLLGLGAVAVGTVLNNGDEVVSRSGDRVVVERDGELRVLKDDNALLRQPGNEIQTENFQDGSTRTTVVKPGGDRVVTIRGADGTVLRRVLVTAQGEEYTLVDDTQEEQEIVVSELPAASVEAQSAGERNEAELRAALQMQQERASGRNFSLRQVREVSQVRALAPQVELDAVRFQTGSAAIPAEQARRLARVGNSLRELIAEDPRTVILVEGHTDAVGDASYNLALSDRRAETVALALTEYFDVPPENMITQGYGESSLKVQTPDAEPANRRAVVRNITPLLR